VSSFDTIPAELRALDQWAVWRWKTRDGKPAKPPYRADDPSQHANSTKPETWGTFEQAVAVVEAGKADGIGFALAPPFVGVDLDSDLPLNEQYAVMLALDSYAEKSASGTGHHVLVKASLNGHGRHPVGIGVFQTGRFFYCTGEHVTGTPTTIEERQNALEHVIAEYLPDRSHEATGPPSQPVDLDDRELLDVALGDAKFRRLWEGDTSAYPSQSEADLALASKLAFYFGRSPPRVEAMFRSSGLYRTEGPGKQKGAGYLARTIEKAIARTSRVYEPQVRLRTDAPRTHPASPPEDGVESASASVRPVRSRDAVTDGRTSTSSVVTSEQPLIAEEAKAFGDVEEASAEPLLGDMRNSVLVAGGAVTYYGDGGAGKTTAGLDRAFHYCAGSDWLGLRVARPLRVLWIENEGPRGKFREKVRAKFETWDGPALEGRLHVLSSPWARFTFANDAMRTEFVDLVRRLEIEVVIAGPVARLGAEGGGTPKEIQAFVDLLELVRADLGRPLAYELIHHENKAGNVSGAWEGATDTLAHVQSRGNGRTAIVWRKTRWAPDLHGKTWKLDWLPGERFELDETPETTDDELREKLVELVRDKPGGSWNTYEQPVGGNATRARRIRDALIEEGRLVNVGKGKAFELYLPEQVDSLPVDSEAA
jgi:hypothetical protein